MWLGARTPFQNIRDPGMTRAYHGLEPIKFAVDSSNELFYRISCFRGLPHGDVDVDADADAVRRC